MAVATLAIATVSLGGTISLCILRLTCQNNNKTSSVISHYIAIVKYHYTLTLSSRCINFVRFCQHCQTLSTLSDFVLQKLRKFGDKITMGFFFLPAQHIIDLIQYILSFLRKQQTKFLCLYINHTISLRCRPLYDLIKNAQICSDDFLIYRISLIKILHQSLGKQRPKNWGTYTAIFLSSFPRGYRTYLHLNL